MTKNIRSQFASLQQHVARLRAGALRRHQQPAVRADVLGNRDRNWSIADTHTIKRGAGSVGNNVRGGAVESEDPGGDGSEQWSGRGQVRDAVEEVISAGDGTTFSNLNACLSAFIFTWI